jgi:hypothetical protein
LRTATMPSRVIPIFVSSRRFTIQRRRLTRSRSSVSLHSEVIRANYNQWSTQESIHTGIDHFFLSGHELLI